MSNGTSFSDGTQYELLVQSVVDYALFMLDPQGRVISWNKGAERIKGYTRDEIIGQHFSAFYAEEDREAGRPALALKTAAETGRFEDEAWRIRKAGTRFWAMVVIDAIRNDAGELVGFAKITRDMTERRQALVALQESERRFRLFVEGVTDYALFMLDPQGIVANWNAGAQRIKGYTAREIIGQHFSRFYAPEDVENGLPATALETARRQGRYEAEGCRVRKDGTRFWANVVIDAIRDEAGELIGFTKITRDITERQETERRLAQAREELFQAQKAEALGQLTAGIAHDFNNLLAAVMSGTALALRQNDMGRIKELLGHIQSAAQRGGELTKKLLAFARHQPLEPKMIDLREHMPSAASLLRHSLSSEIELVTEIFDGIWPIEVDPTQLQLALLNLGFNARDAMPNGGTLRISTRNVTLAGEVDGLVGEYVAIDVSDTGTGIPDEIRDRIFEPFFTTKGFGQGTGLGLSQVFGFAKQSNGTLTVSSEVGKGTVMTLYLPAHLDGTIDAQWMQTRLDRGRGARILVVEDDVLVAELAAGLLKEMGHQPHVVHTAAEALNFLARDQRLDLVFTDIIMPGGISGVELARKVRIRFPELPVLLTTGYSRSMNDQPSEFPLLIKPYEFDALASAIDGLLLQS